MIITPTYDLKPFLATAIKAKWRRYA